MCTDDLINLTVDIFEQQLRNRNTLSLVLDCRPFLAYNESHILNSINIHCPTILRRRKNGVLPLRTIIPDIAIRERLSSQYFHHVILYDEHAFSEDSMIHIVAKCLQQEADLKSAYVLEGGFQKFRQAYPQLCTKKEALRNGNLNSLKKSPVLGNLTWPLKSNGLTLPTNNNVNLKICCNSVTASQTFLHSNANHQILINNNNNNNCTRPPQLTCNNNVICNKQMFINTSVASSEDNNENILLQYYEHNESNNAVIKCSSSKHIQKQQSIDMVDSGSINNHHVNNINHHHFVSSQSHHHNQQTSLHHLNSHHQHQVHQAQSQHTESSLSNMHTTLSGSCSQLNNFTTSNTGLVTNSISLSNLTNLSNSGVSTNNRIAINNNQQSTQCNQCCGENYMTNVEKRSWIPKFNSFGNDALEPVEILPHLLLGSESHASQLDMLKRIGVTALLNVSHSCPNHFEKDFIYKCIPVQDSSFEDISVYFDDSIRFIDQVLENNGRVLVHCHAGISRSATICMAYIMFNMRLRMEDAYEFVKNRRRVVSPNFNFMGQLLSFESIVFGEKKKANTISASGVVVASNTISVLDNLPVDVPMDIEQTTQQIDLNEDKIVDKNSISNSMKCSNVMNTSNTNNIKLIDNTNLTNHHQSQVINNDLNAINEKGNSNANKLITIAKPNKLSIFDFSTNCNTELDFSPMNKLTNHVNIAHTPLLSPT